MSTYVIVVLVASVGVGIAAGIVRPRGAFVGLVLLILGLLGRSSFNLGSLFPIAIGSGVMIGAAARTVVDRRRRKTSDRG